MRAFRRNDQRRRLARSARRAYRCVAASPAVRWVPEDWLSVLRTRLFAISGEDVLVVVRALEAAGCEPCVAGGWGVDALLRSQTRRHSDLDVIIAEGTATPAISALAGVGYVQVSEGVAAGPHMPVRIVARDSPGRMVDVLPLDLAPMRALARTAPAPFGGDETVVLGVILDQPVRCLSPAIQWTFHQGYPTRSHDRNDLPRLRASLRR